MVYRSSFSQSSAYSKCARMWFFNKVLKIDVPQDFCYANAGSVVHTLLEDYYSKKCIDREEMRKNFDIEWQKYELEKSKIALKKPEYWLMVINGIELDIDITSTELRIEYDDILCFIDTVNNIIHEIRDWKTSVRRPENEKEYAQQLKLYAWMYYRKFKIIPSKVTVEYLRYKGEKGKLSFKPIIKDIIEIANWYINIRKEMERWIATKKLPPKCERCFIFCPYKDICDNYEIQLNYTLRLNGQYITVEGHISKILNNQLSKKFSYELKDAYWIKQKKPHANTTIRFWNEKTHKIPIGFYHGLKKTINDYAEWRKKQLILKIVGERIFNTTKVEMHDKLLGGKVLRDYQKEAVDVALMKKIGILSMPTGSGKTLIVAEIIRQTGYKTLFVVDKIELLRQTKKVFEESLGVKIGIVGGGEVDIKDITITTIQTAVRMLDYMLAANAFKKRIVTKNWSIHKKQNNIFIMYDDMNVEDMSAEQHMKREKSETFFYESKKNFYKTYIFTLKEKQLIHEKVIEEKKKVNEFKKYLSSIRFSIMDECHKVASKSFWKLGLNLINTQYRVGLSATPFRDDGNDLYIEAVTGAIIKDINIKELIEKKYLVKPEIIFIKNYVSDFEISLMEEECKRGLINETEKYSVFYSRLIASCLARNQIIIDIANHNNKTNRKTLILVKLVKHGEFLEEEITGSRYLHGGTNKKERKGIMEEFVSGNLNILIGTISIFSEGIDIPILDTVVNAAGNKGDVKTIQVLGRVLRIFFGKSGAKYYDFYDEGKFMIGASRARMNSLKRQGHDVEVIDVERIWDN